jgi:UDP-N-acetylmuramoylalanine--D-glutamate ligase
MLAGSGRRTFASGNDRTHTPILYRLNEVTPDAILVLEISNRQLLGLRYSPHIAVITNLAPHHLDDHGSFAAYVRAKAGVLAHQQPGDWAILNADNPPAWDLASACRGGVLPFSRLRPVREGACLVDGQITVRLDGQEHRLCAAAELQAPGLHALENALAAALAASKAGARPEAVAAALRKFRGLPYRMRLAAEIGGVRYYEDSLATNPAAAAAAIRAFDRHIVLIAGGQRAGASAEDFRPMAEALSERPVRGVLVIGAMAPHIAAAVEAARIPAPVVRCGTLDAAVRRAREIARPGDVVAFSPGCESFDQFRDYRERGDRFFELVSALAREAGAGLLPSARWS